MLHMLLPGSLRQSVSRVSADRAGLTAQPGCGHPQNMCYQVVLVFEALGLGNFKADPVLHLCSSPSLFGVLNVIKSPVYFQPLTNRVAPGAGLREEGTAFSPPPASTRALSCPLIPGLLPPLAVFRSLRVRATPAMPVGRSHPSPLPHQEPRPARLDGNVVRGARTRTEASKGDGMNQGAVLGPRRGRFQRVPASSRWLWAHLEGGSLTPQLPHLHGLSFPTGVPCLPPKQKAGADGGGSKVSLLNLQLLFAIFQNLNSSLQCFLK